MINAQLTVKQLDEIAKLLNIKLPSKLKKDDKRYKINELIPRVFLRSLP